MVAPMAKKFFTVTPRSERALSAAELAQYLHTATGLTATPCNTVQTAVHMALSQAEEDDVICIFGSLYFVGEIRRLFNKTTVVENRVPAEEKEVVKKEKEKKKKGFFSFFKKK